MSARIAPAALAFGLGLLACGDDRPPASPARFDRPSAVGFACVENGTTVPLERCRNATTGDDLALHALVAQSARGEIAAVNLESRQVLDSRRDVPGFTFVPVGENPVAVLVPARHAEVTYVANYGSRDVRVLDTDSLVAPLAGNPTLQTVRLSAALDEGPATAGPTDMALTPDEDALIVTAPEVGRVFYLPIQRCAGESMPECREGHIDEAAIVEIPLEGSRDRLRVTAAEPSDAPSYQKLCGFDRPPLAPLELPDVPDEVMTTTPRPAALAIDADCAEGVDCRPRALVADGALPIVHALDLVELAETGDADAAVLQPLYTGVPTRAVAVTPWVPADLEGDGQTQFVYAIDATDGSVLALEQDQLISVGGGPLGRGDRISFNSTDAANALAVITPAFDPGADPWLTLDQCTDEDHPTQNPARLRGVFLAVALSDQTVRIVDVHDMELREHAEPSDGRTSCRPCIAGIPVLVRNQQRLAVNFVTEEGDEPPSLMPTAVNVFFVDDGLPFAVRSDGTTGSPVAPGLECIPCSGELTRAYPPDTDGDGSDDPGGEVALDGGVDGGVVVPEECSGRSVGLLCADPDPWVLREPWRGVFEGRLPSTGGRLGRIVPEGSPASVSGAMELQLEDELDFCAAGTLGEDDIEPSYEGECAPLGDAQSAETHGDQLVVLARPMTSDQIRALDLPERDEARLLDQCESLRDALAEEDAPAIGFEIRRAYRNRLILRTTLAHAIGNATRFEDVAPCLSELRTIAGGASSLLAFDVRTLNQFAVEGTASGFLHRVRATSTGRCTVDPEGDPLRQGRARLGCTFRNGAIEFRIRRPESNARRPPPLLDFRALAETPARKLFVNAVSTVAGSVIGVQLRWNEVDQQLYLVDVHGRGLMPLPVDPLPLVPPRSFN